MNEQYTEPDVPSHHDKSAVALTYKSDDSAPRIVAKGYGLVAEAIIDRAVEHGLYVHRSPELMGLLMQVDLDARIPSELYLAIAELLAWVYELEQHTATKEST